jgi:hypothetical protein
MKLYFFEAYFDKLGRTCELLDSTPTLEQYAKDTKMLRLAADDRSAAESMVKKEYPSARFLLLHEVRELDV